MNKKASLIGGYWLGALIGVAIILVLQIYLFSNDGRVTIIKNFKPELDQCEANYDTLLKSCPKTECDCGSSGLVWSMIGLFVYVGSLFFMWWASKQNDKREERLKEREDRLDKLERRRRK